MRVEVYNRIQGYLDGLTNIISFYGVLYSHTYKFIEYDNVNNIDECAERFFKESPINKHGTSVVGMRELDDWKSELFESCSDWFFSIFSMRNFEVSIQEEDGNTMPAQKHRESNGVFNGLLKLLEEFFGDEDLKVYKLMTEPAWIDEFAWEQFFFQCGNKVYVLSFYQQG
ncbi:hypothetical protein [Acetivibrio mesophilus]|uniref:Uncharacterized protein n=1 Tax=Acetivibrio mesophilus TaxID=2487273 RepID=A0A4Q0I408_9FIRM|nr:hypothetical protein [Acetivibrio mesophilus]ODM26608.1 hypothetical protein A7W90_10460 [Clostridium sp. Bc-iso-3]RXE58961.1 hypothetical protein EFD62_10030 [Acetivibrio mesophilus]HHV28515.1 hypothetical protein [Clostridium sp.]